MLEEFAVLYERHYRLILTIAQQRLGGFADAEDVTAEVFQRALAKHQDSGEITLAWVYQTLRHVIGHEYRRRDRAPLSLDDALLAGWDLTDSADPDLLIYVRHEMADLSEQDREVLFMAYWEDLTRAEMAEILGCSTPAVRVRLSRASARLRRRLAIALDAKGSSDRHG